MSEKSGFFNAERLPDGTYDRLYLADSFAAYFASFIGNGVFGGSMGALQVVRNESFGVAVQNGQGWINGYWYQNDSNFVFSIPTADTTGRYDSVVLRLDLMSRSINLVYRTGEPSASPLPVTLTRNNLTWELRLCNIYIAPNVTSITPDNIIDTRFDTNQCGLVHGVVDQLNTTEYGNRLDGFINDYIANVADDYQEKFLTPLTDQANLANHQRDNFYRRLGDMESDAMAYAGEYRASIDGIVSDANSYYQTPFLSGLNSLSNLASAAYNDFLTWLAQKETTATNQVNEFHYAG